MPVSLEGAVAVVTGASRGIGRATAVALARAGADVVCAARSTEGRRSKLPGTIEETAAQVEALGRRALAVACDVGDEAQVTALAERTLSEFGRVDVLVNNAAVNAWAPFAEAGRYVGRVINVNLTGTMLCTSAFLTRMLAQGSGRVINVSSGAAADVEAAVRLGIIPYAVSKAAVEKLTELLAVELRPHGVAVNCLRIESAVATEGARLVGEEADVGEWVAPEVAAEALVWLATREVEYTGRIVTMADALRA